MYYSVVRVLRGIIHISRLWKLYEMGIFLLTTLSILRLFCWLTGEGNPQLKGTLDMISEMCNAEVETLGEEELMAYFCRLANRSVVEVEPRSNYR